MANQIKIIKNTQRKEFLEKINDFTDYMKYQHYSISMIQKYNSHLQKYYSYCINNNIKNFYSQTTISNYINSLSEIHCSYFITFSKKVLNKFSDFYLSGSFKFFYIQQTSIKTSKLNYIFSLFKEYLNISELRNSTVLAQSLTIKKFLIYLENNNILSLKNQRLTDYTFKYINSSNLSSATKSNYSNIIKKFLNFTFNNRFSNVSGDDIFPRIHTNSRKRILSFYSTDEISSVLKSIDTSTSLGKRNYVIALLASTLGLRASDIANLKLSNFDFNNKLLKITQQKTQKSLIQPFTEDVLFALLDYLKNGRPSSNSDYIFIKSVAPFDRISPACLSTTITKYFKLSNIDISNRKHGLHSLRHSLANNMLHNNISLQDISATLGHSYISTTTMYTNIDLKTLKLLSLEVAE